MNEHDVMDQSRLVYLAGMIICLILMFITHKAAYPIGFTIGYGISLLVFILIVKMSDLILTLQKPVIIVVLMYLLKMALYALGFTLAVLFPQYVNLFSVFFALMIPKLTIYAGGFRERRKSKT